MHMKDRALIETELELVRNQRKTKRLRWIHPESMRGAEDALDWILAGRPSPAPLSDEWRDPTDALQVQREADVAQEVRQGLGARRRLSKKADTGFLGEYAEGVSETLGWACGVLEFDAMGRDDDDIRDEAEALVGH